MKKILISFTFLLSTFTFSQIKKLDIIKCEEIGYVTQGAYDIINEKCGTDAYKFSFRDFNYSKITVSRQFEFKDIDNSYNLLFEAIINGFNNTKEEIAFELPNSILIIKYMNSLGIKGVSFNIKDKLSDNLYSSNYFSKNQIYKLFGKKKN